MKWTEDQEQVLASDSDNLLVSASAGSGKTMTVIEKIARLIADKHIDITNLLVITFTESASAEMKIRLKDTLSKYAKDNKFIATQLAKLPLGDISTIHAFCAKMLRKFFFLAGIKPNFAVLDDNASSFLKAKALDKTIKQYAESEDEDFVVLSSSFGGGRKFEGLKSSILSLQDFLTGIVDREEYIKTTAFCCYDSKDNKAIKFLDDYLQKNIRFVHSQLLLWQEQAKIKNATYFVEFLQKAIVQMAYIMQGKNFWQRVEFLHSITMPRMSNKKLSDDEQSFKEEFKPLWAEVQSKLKTIKQYIPQKTEQEAMEELNNTRKLIKKLVEVEQVFEKHYEAQKNKRNGLDFADLERKFLEISRLEDVQKTLQYSYVFVDEYQDINYVQEEIIAGVIKNAKLVMVGDVKQSIYAFRNSTPEIFAYKSADYLNNSQHGSLRLLNDNFRSDATILQFSNEIFSKCMTMEFGGIDYKNCGMFRGLAKYEHLSPLPVVEVDLINTKQEESEEEIDLPRVYSISNDKMTYQNEISETKCEGLLIAKKILDMMKNGYQIYDAKQQKATKINFGDIAILCRNNQTLKEISKQLSDLKIPTKINTKDNIYQNKDIAPLLALLKLIDNYHDDNALATALLSPFGNLSPTNLAHIRKAYGEEKYFYQAVKNYLVDAKEKMNGEELSSNNSQDKIAQSIKENIDITIVEKLVKFENLLKELREMLTYSSLHEILNSLCDKFEYYDYLTCLPDGFAREKIVRDFVDSFEGADYNYDLVGFLDFVKNYAFEGRFASMLATSDSGVTLSTIHASKGLEYPIVFVAGCGNNFPTKTFKEDVLKDKNYGLAMQSFDSESFFRSTNYARNCILINKRRAEKCEEMRLLYVALTRAKNHLIVIGEKDDEVFSEENAEGANNYLNWVMTYLKPAEQKAIAMGKRSISKKLGGGEVLLQVFDVADFRFDEENHRKIVFPEDDKNLTKEIKENLLQKMPKPCNIALKNSVSSLLAEHSSAEESLNFSPQTLSVYESKNDNIDKGKLGTAYHKIMEQIDWDKPLNRGEFAKILDKINLPEEYKNIISFEKIATCENNIKELGKIVVGREIPFMSYLPYNQIFGKGTSKKILVQGVADMLLSDGKHNWLIDYKTTKATHPDQLVEKYKVQLMLYQKCLQYALGQKIDGAYIYSFALDKLIRVL